MGEENLKYAMYIVTDYFWDLIKNTYFQKKVSAGFFSGELDEETLYFGLMSFLIVAGLFFSYGYVYDKLLDREHEKNSLGYMFLHIFLILCLTNLTNALEFMREPEISVIYTVSHTPSWMRPLSQSL